MGVAEVRKFCELDNESRALIKSAMSQMQLTARAYHRILKLARTIADLASAERVAPIIWPKLCSTAPGLHLFSRQFRFTSLLHALGTMEQPISLIFP